MTVLVTKASEDYWYEIRKFDTMEDIQRFIEERKHGIIIEKNDYTSDADFKFWDNMKAEDIPTIKQCPLHITIYDDYVE